MDVGFTCAYLATSLAKRITGGTVYRRWWGEYHRVNAHDRWETTMTGCIAVINAGSSSIKFALFDSIQQR